MMSVWRGLDVSRYVECPPEIKVNPNGVDIGISKIVRVEELSTVILEAGSSVVYPSVPVDITKRCSVEFDGVQYYSLKEGIYVLRLSNKITVPNGAVGLVFPRSTLNRYGILMHQTAVWDSGYSGFGTLTIRVNLKELRVDKRVKWFQLMFIDADKVSTSDLYDGSYQDEV